MQAAVRDNNVDQRETSKSYEKLARIRRLLTLCYKESQFNEILELDGDINYRMPDSGNTALHFAVKSATFEIDQNKKIAKQLIDRGADPTVANRQGQTPVHLAAGNFEHPVSRFFGFPYIKDLLSFVHIQNKNTTNLKDVHGFSHFHTACMINDLKLVEFFLNNDVLVNEAVVMDSPEYPGYTSLHFATEYGYSELVDRLLDHGAHLLKDSRGLTPLHMLIRRNMEIIQHASLYRIKGYDDALIGIVVNEATVLAEMESNEKMITSIVSMTNETALAAVDLFPFYVLRTLDDDDSLRWTQSDINKCIPMDSACWPGYTAMHFAARFNRVGTVKVLLEKGADIDAKDADGVSPFDLCVGRYSVEDIHSIISSHNVWKNILLSDGKTKLLELVLAMRDPENLAGFLNDIKQNVNDIFIPRDSPLWPGFTMLHLAVTLSKKRMRSRVKDYVKLFYDEQGKKQFNESIEACLRLGADVAVQDRDGSTPVHLAFRRMDLGNMYLLLNRCDGKSNPTDKHNLSLLHIACVFEDVKLVRELLSSGAADPNASLSSSSFQWDTELRYFHELSSDEHLHVWPGSTALHAAFAMSNLDILKLLLEAGADLNAEDIYGLTPVHRLLIAVHNREDDMEFDDLLSRLVSRDCAIDGLSYLHVAAYCGFSKFFEKLLSLGANVNSVIVARERVFMKSYYSILRRRRKTKFSYFFNYFEGNTPLHMALENTYGKGDIPQKLISGGADVLAKNSMGIPPIFKIMEEKRLLKYYVCVMSEDDERRIIEEIGLTKLHMACRLCDVKMIRDCLKNGANVNARVRDDSKIWPGCTPLHIAVGSYSHFRHGINDRRRNKEMCLMVRLLLNNGADVLIANAKGETPLMMDVRENYIDTSQRPAHMDILWKELKNSEVNPVSDRGLSHFHLACIRKDVTLVERFLKLGANPNQCVDYLSKDYPGYTPLHFAVSHLLYGFICSDLPALRTVDLLLKYGANVNATDVKNDTPLHLAASYPSLCSLPYKRMFWAGADPEAKNLYGLAPSSNPLFNVEKGEVIKCFRICYRFYLLDKLVTSFSDRIRCFYRKYNGKVRRWYTNCNWQARKVDP